MRHVLVLAFCAVAIAAAAAPDAEIEANIRARMAKSKISTNAFQVKVRNGTAVLTGRTEVPQHKGVATRLAKAGGAVKVDNRIEISEAARAKATQQLSRAREEKKLSERSSPRSDPRSAPRGETPIPAAAPAAPSAPPSAPPAAPPPVRRAVVKH